jgi:hypothetical protein
MIPPESSSRCRLGLCANLQSGRHHGLGCSAEHRAFRPPGQLYALNDRKVPVYSRPTIDSELVVALDVRQIFRQQSTSFPATGRRRLRSGQPAIGLLIVTNGRIEHPRLPRYSEILRFTLENPWLPGRLYALHDQTLGQLVNPPVELRNTEIVSSAEVHTKPPIAILNIALWFGNAKLAIWRHVQDTLMSGAIPAIGLSNVPMTG